METSLVSSQSTRVTDGRTQTECGQTDERRDGRKDERKDGRTDRRSTGGRTDGRNYDPQYRVSIAASRGKTDAS